MGHTLVDLACKSLDLEETDMHSCRNEKTRKYQMFIFLCEHESKSQGSHKHIVNVGLFETTLFEALTFYPIIRLISGFILKLK